MVLSGVAMVVVGAWLTAQAIGGNLAGRIRSWASSATGTGSTLTTKPGDDPDNPGRFSGGGPRT